MDNLFGDILSDLKGQKAWEKEWQGMPEYIQEDISPEYCIIVNFKNLEDLMAFGKFINQKITYRTASIWFPKGEIVSQNDKKYIDDES